MQRLVELINQPNWKIMLYDLVKSNELDLWDINLVMLTDLYLEKIRTMKEQNLILPANALLAAAILLRLKANSLKLTSIGEDQEPLKIPADDYFGTAIDLEAPARLKEGQVSLDELIGIIDGIMHKPTKKNIDRQLSEKIEEFIVPKSTVDISLRIESFYSTLQNSVDSEGCAVFSKFKRSAKDSLELIDNYFIPMLFLSMDSKINIWQDNFFDDIFIKIL